MATKSFYPNIGILVTINDFPEELQFLEDGLQNALDKIYYKELQYVRSNDGSQGYYDIVLVTGEQLKLGLFGTGFSIVLNPGGAGETIIPLTINYNWPVLALISNFKLEQFSFLPDALQNMLNQTISLGDADLIETIIDVFEDSNELSGYENFVDKINQHYSLSGGDEIPYPQEDDPLYMAEEIRSAIEQNSVITDDVQEVANQIYILSSDSTTFKDNLDRFTNNITSESILDYIKGIIIPNISASLELSLGLAFPRNILLPVDSSGNPLPEPEQSMLVFVPGTLEFSTQGGINFQEEMSTTLYPETSQIGNTGLGISILKAKIDLSKNSNIIEADLDGRSQDFIGVYAQYVAITLPHRWFNNVDNTTLRIAGYNMLVGTGGVSGTIALEAVNGTPSPGDDYMNMKIGNWEVGFNHFAMTFKQNAITDSHIAGRLTIPKLTNASGATAQIDVMGHLNEVGDFNLTASEPEGIPFHIFDFVTINMQTVELGRQDDLFYLGASAEIWFDNPVMDKILKGQKITVPKIRIYDNGKFEIVGGASAIPANITLDLGPVEVAVTGIHFGSHQQNGRKYNYWGFDGAISLDPLGLDARGEGIKYYYSVDNEEIADLHGGNAEDYKDSFLKIQTIEVNLVIPGSASPDTATAIIYGMLSIPEPGDSPEYIGNVSLKMPKANISAGVGMRLQPRHPAFLVDAYLELPKPIPLGPLGIYGFQGLLGYRYVARKEAVGLVTGQDSWYDYYNYPQRGINPPKFHGPEETEVFSSPFSFGAGALLATGFDDGWAASARVMLLLSVPSLFLVEGRAAILSERIGLDSYTEPPFYAFMAWGNSSIEMGMSAQMDLPKSGPRQGDIIKLFAEVDAQFFMNMPSQWHINFGTEVSKVDSKLLTMFTCKSYLQISAQGIKGAAQAEYELKKRYGPAKAHLHAYFEVGGYISFEKPQIGGYIAAGGSVAVDIWFIGFSISIDALFSVEAPEPFKIYAQLKIKVCAKVLFVKKCFKFTVVLNWEKNDIIDRTPIPPLPYGAENGLDRTDESAKGVHMLTNETYEINKFPVLVDAPGNWQPNVNNIDKIVPLDTYIDIKTSKGVNPAPVLSKVGGYVVPPQGYKDLIPPEKVVRGMSLRQVKHVYSIEAFELKAWNGSNWIDYHPYEAVVKHEDPQELDDLRNSVSDLRIGYWQRSGQQYNAIRILGTNPFSYTEAGEPGWFVPEQYGITPSTLFCEGVEQSLVCCNFLNKPLGTTWHPASQMNGHLINGAYFNLELGNVGYATLNFDGTLNVVEAANTFQVTDAANTFGMAKSLEFENGNTLVIYLPAISAEIKMKLTSAAENIKVRYYRSGLDDDPSTGYVLVAEMNYSQAQLAQEIHYLNVAEPIAKITIEPSYLDLDAINALTAQIAALVGTSYGAYTGTVSGLNAQDQAAYDNLMANLNNLLGDGCGGRNGKPRNGRGDEDCITSLQQLCWLSLEDYEYNELIPGQEAIEEDSLAMEAAVKNVVQPIWRPDTAYYVRFRLRDNVDNGVEQRVYDHYYAFKTVGPLGHYHNHPDVDYLPQDATPEEYPLTSLRRYIDYRRSYPNADGNLLLAKPVFYSNRQCKITLYFTKPLAYNMLNTWYAYKGMPDRKSALHIAIKDPVSDVIVPYPLPVDYFEETVPVPEEGNAWNEDTSPLIPLHIQALNNQINQGNDNPGIYCELAIGNPLIPSSQFFQVVLTNLKPQKLYTALFFNAYDKNGNGSLEDTESEQVHQYVFQTSRYPNFREQVESFKLRELDGEGNIVVERNAVFTIDRSLSSSEINSALSLCLGTPDSGAIALQVQYQHYFDRVVEGLFGIVPINPPETTEFNLVRNAGNVLAIIIKNPEPFNNPNMPLGQVQDTLMVLNGSGAEDVQYIRLFSKDLSQVLIMHVSGVITAQEIDLKFSYKEWNGNIYNIDLSPVNGEGQPLNEVVIENLVIN